MSNDYLIKKLSSELKPVSPLANPLKRFLRWFIFGLVIISVAASLLGIRHDFIEIYSSPRFIFETILLLFITITSSIAAFHLAIPGEERKINKWLILLPLLLWLIEMIISIILDGVIWDFGIKCSSTIIIMGLPMALVFYFMVQKSAPTLPRWTGWFALIAAFSLSAFTEQFTCHNGHPLHLLVWHFLPIVIIGGIGMFFFKRRF